MIKNMLRGSTMLLLALAPLTVPTVAVATPMAGVPVVSGARVAAVVLPLADAVDQLTIVDESRTGYDHTKFKHWNSGLDPADGCNTRAEALLDEAIEAPVVAAGCKLSGGLWHSYYDAAEVTDPAKLDIDHLVPLAESWDSGSSAWDAKRREAYANDQDVAASLVPVTARANRAKADKDPAEWMPPLPDAHCRYISEWTATKLRWGLSSDQAEADALKVCETTVVHYTPAP